MSRRYFGPSCRRHHRRGKAGAATAQIPESGHGLRVGPLQVVDQKHQWPVPGHDRDEGLQHLEAHRTPAAGWRGRTREGSGRVPAAARVDLDAGERVPERRGQRHVRQVALELGAAGPPDPGLVEPSFELVEQAGLPEPRFALDLDQDEVPASPSRAAPASASSRRSGREAACVRRLAAPARSRSPGAAASPRSPAGGLPPRARGSRRSARVPAPRRAGCDRRGTGRGPRADARARREPASPFAAPAR